jgi:hypothetical protein
MKKGRMKVTSIHGFFFKVLLSCALMFAAPVAAPAQTKIVCIQCHGALPGRLGEPVKLWQQSIHAANNVFCNECHGGDPKDAANAMSPARGFIGAPKEKQIPDVCGRCHIGVKRDYLASAHGRALGNGGPTCVTCHGNHLVRKASLDLINEKSCSRCHGYKQAGELKSAMQRTEDMIISIENGINAFKNEGVDTDTLEKGLFSMRNQFHTLFHELNLQKVKDESAGINGQLDKLNASLNEIWVQRQKRKIIGAFAVGGTLFAALLFYLLRKTYD